MEKKTILRVQPVYTMLIWFIALCCFITFLFLPQILKWEVYAVDAIIYYCLMGLCAVTSLLILLYYIQFAYVNSNGIVIKNLFYQITSLTWDEIHSINYQKIMTYDNRTNISLNWIVIKLHASEFVRGSAGRNRRKKSPWCIIATKKILR